MQGLWSRRKLLATMGAVLPAWNVASQAPPSSIPTANRPGKLKIGLNAYSFHKPLTDGKTTLEDLLEFCAGQHLDGVDLTAYYFPGYPEVPPDEYLYGLKYRAFRCGVDITGTGIRNDFTNPDESARKEDVKRVKEWILAASKIGAPVIRIFSGHLNPETYKREAILNWMVRDISECVAYGRQHGVVVAVQNHHDFLKTADQTIELLHLVNSPWFGLILDTGSFRKGDPYDEIARCIPYAVNWQVKELIYRDGVAEKVDLDKLLAVVKASAYRGYLPVETLGPGDPFEKVPVFIGEFREALRKM